MRQPDTISTTQRIFQIEDHDGNTFLCNLSHLQLKDLEQIRRLKHYCNNKFESFGKIDLKEMLISYN